jgi:translocation and assembly module TamA
MTELRKLQLKNRLQMKCSFLRKLKSLLVKRKLTPTYHECHPAVSQVRQVKTLWKILTILACLALSSESVWAAVSLGYKITGISGETEENADKRLKGKLTLIKKDLDHDQLMIFYHQAENEIKLAVAPYGYFQAKVSSRLQWIGKDKWMAYFSVQPGPKILLKNLRVKLEGQGLNDPAFQKVLADFPLKRGQEFTVKNYDDAKNMFINLAAQRGYFDAHMTENKLVIDQQPYGADVALSFRTGPRYRFGHVNFKYSAKPKTRLDEALLRRYIPFKESDLYDNELLSKLQSNLSSSLYFQSVAITPHTDKLKRIYVPITVTLTARKSQQYNFGLGFSTDTGIRGLTDINIKPLNAAGHYVSFNAKASGSTSQDNTAELKASYNIPGRDPNTDLYKLTAETTHSDDNIIGTSNSVKMNASYTTSVLSWEQTSGVTLLYERSEPIGELENTTTFLIPNVRWIKIKSDDPIAASNGYRINFSLRGASKGTLGSTDFFQAYLQAKWLHTFGESFRVVARAELGQLIIDDPFELPLSLRYYAGGSQSVRGYHMNEIGKDNSGRTLSVGSLEFQQRIYGDFYLAIFYDAGEVGSSYFSGYKQGVGAGIVWHSPIGAIALTAANAMDNPNHPNLIQFSMGPEL